MAAGASGVVVISLGLAAPNWAPDPALAPPPPPPSLPQPESRPVAGPLTLASLRVGPEPWVMAAGRRVVASFLTDDPEICRIVATARLRPGLDPKSIRWTVAAPLGFIVPVEGVWTGPKLSVALRRPGGNPNALGGPLALTVQARVEVDGEQYTARETIVQDEIDQLRQEYVDLGRRRVPGRGEFLDAAAFAAHYGKRYPWLRFEDLNWSVNPTTRERFSYAIIRPELVAGLANVRREYGLLIINSGYRNPTRQVEVHAPVRESLHQYGYAVDLGVVPGEGRSLPDEADWRRLAEAGCRARAKWVEPLSSSSPNSPGCHVHLDYRPGAVSSAPVTLRGHVVAADTGRPVPGALVLLGGMPAQTNEKGYFAVRNVLSGGRYPVEVRAAGYETRVQPVALSAWRSVSARLTLQTAAPSGVTAAVARAEWVNEAAGLLAVTLRVSNTGAKPVEGVRVSAAAEGAALASLEPAELGTLAAGAARGVRAVVRVGKARGVEGLPMAVGLTFRVPGGEAERARYRLLARLPAETPSGGAAAGVSAAGKTAPAPAKPIPMGPPVPAVAAPVTTRPPAPKGGTAAPEEPTKPAEGAPGPTAPKPAEPAAEEPQGAAPPPAEPSPAEGEVKPPASEEKPAKTEQEQE